MSDFLFWKRVAHSTARVIRNRLTQILTTRAVDYTTCFFPNKKNKNEFFLILKKSSRTVDRSGRKKPRQAVSYARNGRLCDLFSGGSAAYTKNKKKHQMYLV